MFRNLILYFSLLTVFFTYGQDIPENPNLIIGKKSPNIVFTDTAGINYTLHSTQSVYTVLILYSSDCDHCMIELPKIYEAYSKARKRKYEVVALNTHHPYYEVEPTKALLKKHKFSWINGIPVEFQTERDYFLYATPSIFVLDKDKNIISKRMFNAADLQATLKQLKIIK